MSKYVLYIHEHLYLYGINVCQYMKLFQFLIGFKYGCAYTVHLCFYSIRACVLI